MYYLQCAMCNIQFAMYNLQCIMYNVQCAMCNVQCAMCNVQCAMCNVQCINRQDLTFLELFDHWWRCYLLTGGGVIVIWASPRGAFAPKNERQHQKKNWKTTLKIK
jgi:hypothetical protein